MKRRSVACAAVLCAIQLGALAPAASAQRPDGVTRFAGADRYSTAVAVTRGSFPGGADDLFLVSGTDFPDGLAAGAAAASVDGALLPTTKSPDDTPDAVIDEVDRIDPVQIWLVGGPNSLSTDYEAIFADAGIPVARLAGADRYGTAAAVADEFFDLTTTGAYYASGLSFADSLAGGAAAAKRGWPLLLTKNPRPAVTPKVGGAKIALGGRQVLSDEAVAELGARRVAGADRYETAVQVSLDAFPAARTAYLASGLKFPDALSATPAASLDDAPVLLSRPSCVSSTTAAEFRRLGATARVVVGGQSAVSDAAARLTVC